MRGSFLKSYTAFVRYLILTPVNGWSPLYLDGEIKDNKFTVKTTKDGNPEQEFSWVILPKFFIK